MHLKTLKILPTLFKISGNVQSNWQFSIEQSISGGLNFNRGTLICFQSKSVFLPSSNQICGHAGWSPLAKRKTILPQINVTYLLLTSGLYYKAGFAVSEVTSGLALGFRSYDTGSLLTRVDLHGNLC